jgi:hypothetical protein
VDRSQLNLRRPADTSITRYTLYLVYKCQLSVIFLMSGLFAPAEEVVHSVSGIYRCYTRTCTTLLTKAFFKNKKKGRITWSHVCMTVT